jgi:hypothetical protein
MRDKTLDLATRIDCARSAAPYVHPKLASVAVGGNAAQGPLRVQVLRFSDLPPDERPPER